MDIKKIIISAMFFLSLMGFSGATAQLKDIGKNAGEKKVMLMNRIGPSSSELFIANVDGTGEHKLFENSGFDYHASFSADGKWITFTSERNGFGQADIYRVHSDGTGLERLTDSPSLDDQAALSPDGTQVAFVSTREKHTANIWILNLKTRNLRNLSGQPEIAGEPTKPNGFFHPSWSPDGKWIAFSSDRNTEWKGRGNNAAWEHVQELGIYIIQSDGKGLRKISPSGICAGTPKWSQDGKRVVFYELPIEQTWDAHRPNLAGSATSQIVSVDINTNERVVHTSGTGLKLLPQFLNSKTIAYLSKAGSNEGLAYTNEIASVKGKVRSPSWSPDGKVIYEKVDFRPRPQNQQLYSWESNCEYRYTDVFPNFSNDGKLVLTEKDDNSSLAIMDSDGSNKKRIYPAVGGAAFSPSWSPDGQWIAFGFGGYLQSRKSNGAKILMIKRDGSNAQDLTEGLPNAGFPSWSADGKRIVYRVWGDNNLGLRILNIEDHSVQVLTTEYDNLPFWSPDGTLISFTRKHDGNNFDIFTIKPDGTDLRQLTTSLANDAHAFWTDDSKHLMWSSGIYGFKDEAALYDNTFQPYGSIFIMNADGSDKRQLTDSPWEDSMPRFVPNIK